MVSIGQRLRLLLLIVITRIQQPHTALHCHQVLNTRGVQKRCDGYTAHLHSTHVHMLAPPVAACRDNDVDTAALLDNLHTHKYQALVLDAPVVSYFASMADACDLYPVGDLFESFSLAIAFPPDSPTALAANISTSIVRLQVGMLAYCQSSLDPDRGYEDA